MEKLNIPTAESMADLAARNIVEYEKSIMEGGYFRGILQRIEAAAIEGRTEIRVVPQSREQRQALKVISRHLIQAGYKYGAVAQTFPLILIPEIVISWESNKKP